MLVLNIVLAIAVIAGVLCLLSWAIVSSRAEPPLTSQVRPLHPYARPHIRHPYWTAAHRPQLGSREPADPVAG